MKSLDSIDGWNIWYLLKCSLDGIDRKLIILFILISLPHGTCSDWIIDVQSI